MGEILPEYLSKMATDRLRDNGVNIVTGETPVKATLNKNKEVELDFASGGMLYVLVNLLFELFLMK